MATYAIGDVQGCFRALQLLLDKIRFDPEQDTLWFCGDLVNRGPNNLSVLRFVKRLGSSVKVVLGNHDLHLLAVHAGAKQASKKDTIQDIFQAPDCDELLFWLRQQPLIHVENPWVLTHAGVPHLWTVTQARSLASEVEAVLRSEHYCAFLHEMYGNNPACWSDDVDGMSRLRLITNYLTRMRFVTSTGVLNLNAKKGLETAPAGTKAWFAHPRQLADKNYRFLFGHWAALEGHTYDPRFIALDTGCVWGGALTAMTLETGQLHAVKGR